MSTLTPSSTTPIHQCRRRVGRLRQRGQAVTDALQQLRWHLIAAALAGDDLLELGLEVERVEALHAVVEVVEDLAVLLGRELAVEERLDVAQRLLAVGVVVGMPGAVALVGHRAVMMRWSRAEPVGRRG